jgi:DNA-binding transcriptional LysR family regulator
MGSVLSRLIVGTALERRKPRTAPVILALNATIPKTRAMDLVDQMQTFVRIVDAGSLSSAARGRRLSLAAVSRQLDALERDLGTTLIVRTTRRLQITPAGRRWYQHCQSLLRQLEAARGDVAEDGELRGTLAISAPVTLGTSYVVPRLAALAQAHPRLEIDLRLQDHVIDLVGESVDLAVRGGIVPPDSVSLIAHRLTTFRRAPVASPTYLRRAGTPRHPRELERHDGLVQRGLGPAPCWHFARGDTAVDVTPRVRLASMTPMVLRDWAIAGVGIALLPEWLVDDRLKRLCEGWTTPEIHAWAIHRIELRSAPRIRAAVEALTE